MSQNEGVRSLHAKSAAVGERMVRLPLIVRTAADLQTLRANARAVRRLPRNGISVSVDGLDDAQAKKLRARIDDYVRACGCAEGAITALAAMVVVTVAIGIRISERGPRWSDLGALVAGIFLALMVGGLGKLLGLAIARLRFERCCIEAIRIIGRT